MALAVSQREIDAIRSTLASVKWTNVNKCTFRRSTTGNIVGSDITGNVRFIIKKDGLLVDPQGNAPVSAKKVKIPNFETIRKLGIEQMNRAQNAAVKAAEKKPEEKPAPPPVSIPWLSANNIASQIQGELNASELAAFSSITDKFSVRPEGAHTLIITPFSNSRYTMYVNPIEYSIEKGVTMPLVLIDVKVKLRSTAYEVYLSEYAKSCITKALIKEYKENPAFFFPTSLAAYTASEKFYMWIRNEYSETIPNLAKMNRDGVLFINYLGQDMRYNTRTDELTLVSKETLLKTAALARKNRVKIERVLNQLEKCPSFSLKVNAEAINGYYTVNNKKYMFHQESGGISAKEIMQNILEIKKSCKEEEKALYKSTVLKIKGSSLYGDAVATAVADCVIRNDGVITSHMVINHLRGLTQDTNLEINDSYYKGKFSFITSDYISERIEGLISEGFIIASSGKNNERRACSLKACPYLDEFIKYSGTIHNKSLEEYTDFDWLIYLRKHMAAGSDEMMRRELEVLEHPAVYCLDPELVGEFVAKRPGYWMDYIEMMRFAEKGIKKKYWKAVKEASQKLQNLP